MKIERKNTPIDKLKRAMYIGEQYWDIIRYDVPRFFRNLWMFKKDIYDYCWYSGQHAVLPFMKTALTDMAAKIDERGWEVEHSKSKKIGKMVRAAYIMERFIEDDFLELAEKELGEVVCHGFEFEPVPDKPGYSQMVDKETPEEKEHNSNVFARSREIEDQMWAELWTILKGQEYSDFDKIKGDAKMKEQDNLYNNWFDGSGLRGWWD
jgi:hypothetical protein